MLDLDIIEQLVPNPITMLTTLCSVAVLFLLMKKFLWKSVKAYLDARADKMQEDLAVSEQARQSALEDREQARLQLQEASGRGEEIVAEAVKQAKEEKKLILSKADQEANAVRKKAEEQIEQERQEMYAHMQAEMVNVAMTAVEKLITEEGGETYDRAAVDAYVKEAQNDQ